MPRAAVIGRRWPSSRTTAARPRPGGEHHLRRRKYTARRAHADDAVALRGEPDHFGVWDEHDTRRFNALNEVGDDTARTDATIVGEQDASGDRFAQGRFARSALRRGRGGARPPPIAVATRHARRPARTREGRRTRRRGHRWPLRRPTSSATRSQISVLRLARPPSAGAADSTDRRLQLRANPMIQRQKLGAVVQLTESAPSRRIRSPAALHSAPGAASGMT